MLKSNTCRSCHERQIIDNYNNLKKTLEEEFENYINEWFKAHPNVDNVYFVQKEGWSLYQSITIVPSPLTKETNVHITFK